MRRAGIAVALLITVIAGAAGQTVAPVFEAVSIKVNDSGRDGGGTTPLRNGRWNATNIPLRGYIASAWDIPANRVFGLPAWADITKYDIAAVAPDGATQAQLWPLLVKALLKDRFKVAAHAETRDLPIYNLVLARADGRLGPGLTPAAIDCDAPNWRELLKDKPSARPCGFSWDAGVYTGGGQHLSLLASLLASPAGRPVFDKTGLTGSYDFELKWAPGVAADPSGNGVSIFTAVQEQLGLKLESAIAPLDVLIVDHVERPTAN
jgi:uncharacterized protein (TIGR03435 family)